uniref:Si:dkey-103g5.3 n=1 Tax=Haplochromis burtoni TaxID=8153 RepID=A0A3Q2VU36_HAPBU
YGFHCFAQLVIRFLKFLSCAENSDLMVQCGTSMITLDINLCTVQWAGFNATELALNGQYSNTACQGSVDTSVNPPVVHFRLPVNQSQDNSCRQSLQVIGYWRMERLAVIVTGYINTPRSDQGLISYSTDLYYHFSCRYPLQYLLNNTQITAWGTRYTYSRDVFLIAHLYSKSKSYHIFLCLFLHVFNSFSSSSVSVATSNNNGTFIDSLKMSVFNVGINYHFNLLLDRCFATPTPYNMPQSVQYDFFTGCDIANRTTVTSNGVSTVARFNFEAFRFVQHHDQAKSSIYVHCMLRLCEPSKSLPFELEALGPPRMHFGRTALCYLSLLLYEVVQIVALQKAVLSGPPPCSVPPL